MADMIDTSAIDLTVYCLGDSWTTGFGVNPTECWVRLVEQQTGFKMINAGLNGDITSGMLRRFYRATESVTKNISGTTSATDARRKNFDVLFFLGGGNDILNECRDDPARENVIAILDLAREKNIPVMLSTVFPFVPDVAARLWVRDKDYDAINEVMESYAKWLRETALDYNLCLVDLWKLISDLGPEYRHKISLDGIHLNPEGHRILADFIAARLMNMVSRV